MRFEYLIGIRYLRARRRERFVSLIAVISLAGVAIGAFALTLVLSIMSGFEEDLRDRLLAFNPQITVTFADSAPLPAGLEANLARVPGVTAVTPYASSQVLIVSTAPDGTPEYVSGGTLRAVIARNNPVLTELQKTLTRGSLAALDQNFPISVSNHGERRIVELPGIIVGQSLAQDLDLRPGDPLTIISPASLGAGATPRLRRFAVAGFFHSGMYDFDSSLMFASLQTGEALLADDPQLERGYELRVRDLFAAPMIARRIAAATPGATVSDWTQTDAPLFSALKLEKFTYFLVLMLIVLVAAFNIIATLVMVVMERRKEIAILRAMGARARSIVWIFVCEGAVLGAGGTLLGVGLGWLLSYLIGRYHFIHLPADMFMVSTVPVRLYPLNFIAVAAASIVLCVAGALYPALRARALRPVEVLRYE